MEVLRAGETLLDRELHWRVLQPFPGSKGHVTCEAVPRVDNGPRCVRYDTTASGKVGAALRNTIASTLKGHLASLAQTEKRDIPEFQGTIAASL